MRHTACVEGARGSTRIERYRQTGLAHTSRTVTSTVAILDRRVDAAGRTPLTPSNGTVTYGLSRDRTFLRVVVAATLRRVLWTDLGRLLGVSAFSPRGVTGGRGTVSSVAVS